MRHLLPIALLVAAGCGQERLSAEVADVRVDPLTVRFDRAFVGFEQRQPITVHNASRAPLELTTDVAVPFSAPATLQLGAGETLSVDVAFAPTAEGEAAATLTLHWSDRTTAVELSGAARAAPSCAPSSDCVTSHFDARDGRCVEAPVIDGTTCGVNNRCLTNGVCLSGECVGTARSCDDRNACTHDACDPSMGCLHDDITALCPKSLSACEVPTCDPTNGCGIATAVDGTSCGPNDCSTAKVCMQGRCETRVAPEGSTCAAANACQGAALCHLNSCVRPAASSPRIAWRYTPANPAVIRYTGIMDPEGNVYFVESDDRTTQIVSLDTFGGVRFRQAVQVSCRYCVYYVGIVLDPEQHRLYVGLPRGVQEARSSIDGHVIWRTDLTPGLPIGDPMPDGGAYFGNPRAHPLGTTVLCGEDALCPGLATELTEGYTDHRSYIFGIEPQTGTVLWQIYRKGHLYSPVASGNELFVSSANCWAPAGDYERFSTSNGQRLGGGFVAGYPSAILGGTSVFWNGGLRLVDPQLIQTPISMGNGYPAASGALLTTDRIVALSTEGVVDFDPVTHATRWTAPVGTLRNAEMMLGSNGEVFATGATNDGGAFVAVDRTGEVELSCPLTEAPASPVAVARGHYVAQLGADLVSFDVPGFDAAWTGWTASSGSLARDTRSR